jgi:predicted outer membrane protein
MRHTKHVIIANAIVLLAAGTVLAQQPAEKPATTRAAPGQEHAQQLTEYFTDVLMLADQCEIELAKIAIERSTNRDVQQLAKKLIDDHSQLTAQLKRTSPAAAESFARRDATEGQRLTAAREGAQHDLLTELCQINHRAADNNLKQSKELLNRYKGLDFDMAFLGMQIGDHNWLAAELDALGDVGTTQFQQLVNSATEHVRDHLEAATTLSKKLEEERHAAAARDNIR